MPDQDALPPPALRPVPKQRRDDEIEELLGAIRLPEWDGTVASAADLVGIDRARAKRMIKKEIARVATSPEINGNISATARVLGLKMKTVWNIMRGDSFLTTVNPSADPQGLIPTDAEALDREVLTEEELNEMKAMASQADAVSSLKWDRVGLSPQRQMDMVDLEQFAKGSIQSSLNATHGGLMYCFMEMMDLFKKTKLMFDQDALPIEETQFGAKDAKKEYLYVLTSLTAEIRAINAQVQRAEILRLKAKEIENARKGGPATSRPGKMRPGFSDGPPPVLVKVDAAPGSSIHVNGK